MLEKYKKLLNGNTTFVLGLGPIEVIIIAIVIIALFFGGRKLGDWAKGLGRFAVEFKKGKMEAEKELEQLKSKE